jgi:hypothetical protein
MRVQLCSRQRRRKTSHNLHVKATTSTRLSTYTADILYQERTCEFPKSSPGEDSVAWCNVALSPSFLAFLDYTPSQQITAPPKATSSGQIFVTISSDATRNACSSVFVVIASSAARRFILLRFLHLVVASQRTNSMQKFCHVLDSTSRRAM